MSIMQFIGGELLYQAFLSLLVVCFFSTLTIITNVAGDIACA